MEDIHNIMWLHVHVHSMGCLFSSETLLSVIAISYVAITLIG